MFILPSFKEAFPMVILEAMACGTPVIATRVGDVPHIIRDHESGLVINMKDAMI
jgi:glycosyltransferase involved in cell wall biosynthesis